MSSIIWPSSDQLRSSIFSFMSILMTQLCIIVGNFCILDWDFSLTLEPFQTESVADRQPTFSSALVSLYTAVSGPNENPTTCSNSGHNLNIKCKFWSLPVIPGASSNTFNQHSTSFAPQNGKCRFRVVPELVVKLVWSIFGIKIWGD